ncbi:MAG: hypothetical protein GY749_07660 [Desulfobacteraceae bacterium]|nr:hypothetical protein [Desulfobacteraceae bacterium]
MTKGVIKVKNNEIMLRDSEGSLLNIGANDTFFRKTDNMINEIDRYFNLTSDRYQTKRHHLLEDSFGKIMPKSLHPNNLNILSFLGELVYIDMSNEESMKGTLSYLIYDYISNIKPSANISRSNYFRIELSSLAIVYIKNGARKFRTWEGYSIDDISKIRIIKAGDE